MASRFLRQIDNFRGFGLHAVGQFERLDAGQQVPASPGCRSQVLVVELGQQVELRPLVVARDVARPIRDSGSDCLRGGTACPDTSTGRKPALQLSGPPFTPWVLPSTT